MRLLNPSTLEMFSFDESEVPDYAILSHTWEKDEISFQEMLAPTATTYDKAGYDKIRRFAGIAEAYGFGYIWVDTCCIDKSSSAELSEAINSMYRWYAQSTMCVVFLSDLDRPTDPGRPPGESIEVSLRQCKWFRRGWTLQELIAPKRLHIYDCIWRFVGTKNSHASILGSITGIPSTVLRRCDPRLVSVAQRMFWASGRTTTRVEDEAYSLLGLFDINMPLLYGEGTKAFVRLQEEIIKVSDDETIFSWRYGEGDKPGTFRGLLARAPAEFSDASRIITAADRGSAKPRPYSNTNRGLSIRLPMRQIQPNLFEAVLECRTLASPPFQRHAIHLLRLDPAPDQFARVDSYKLGVVDYGVHDRGTFEMRDIYVRQKIELPYGYQAADIAGFHLADVLLPNNLNRQLGPDHLYPFDQWEFGPRQTRLFRVDPTVPRSRGLVVFTIQSGRVALLLEWDQATRKPATSVLYSLSAVTAEHIMSACERMPMWNINAAGLLPSSSGTDAIFAAEIDQWGGVALGGALGCYVEASTTLAILDDRVVAEVVLSIT
jgi:hypothetical protein